MIQETPHYRAAFEALDWAVEAAERAGAVTDAGVVDRVGAVDGASIELLPPSTDGADFQLALATDRAAVRARLDRIMMAEDAEAGLDALLACGALGALLPQVEHMVGFSDGEWRHKDVWKHTKQVVRQAVPRLEVRWAALLHDIGKVKTRSITPDGQVHFHGHAEVGARMFDRMERRTPLFVHEASLHETIRFLVLHHLRASQYDKSWTDSAVRRFAREVGPHMDDLFCLSRADITTKRPQRKRHGLSQINELQARVTELARQDAEKPALPKGLGSELMSAFGVPPSKRLGNIMKALESHVRAGRLPAGAAPSVYVAFLEENRALLDDA